MDSKKKMFYSVDMDPHFIAVNIIALLYALKRFDEKRKFKFPQKLSSLIYFINAEDNVSLFKLKLDKEYKLKLLDYERLNNIFLKSKIIEPQINRVLNTLNDKGYICTCYNNNELSIYLNKKKCKFICEEIFSDLIKNTIEIQKIYIKISSVQYETYYSKLFKGIEYNE
ncbi:hypothetical protein [Tepidibacter hydrothermalis]|uniref:Uncharacterized protein n=1 Tax=Tepidibacter hydrothermalis TaxID=3036126 RepID=A0ABY8E792_9FIRM|nr:hypothetical protein [Tepidibacter hydrothermalis]WFD08752.1 hypothetical protein P4S50_10115 [Tepidibacter hydrothermalis]